MSRTRGKATEPWPSVDGHRAPLPGLGYTPGSAPNELKARSQLGWRLTAQRLTVSPLSTVRVEGSCSTSQAGRRLPGLHRYLSLLDYLRDERCSRTMRRSSPTPDGEAGPG